MIIPYTYENLNEAAKLSNSYSEILFRLGRNKSGSAFTSLKRNIDKFGINITHLLNPKRRGGVINGKIKKKKAIDILILHNKCWKQSGSRLAKALLEIGREYKCSECGITDTWNNKSITLEVDHIDGNNLNNVRNNLRFVCPNCHSQFPTSKNIRLKKPDKFCQCGIKINRTSESCPKCAAIAKGLASRKITRPNINMIKKEIEQSSFSAVGRKYGVSDNAIRKWIKV